METRLNVMRTCYFNGDRKPKPLLRLRKPLQRRNAVTFKSARPRPRFPNARPQRTRNTGRRQLLRDVQYLLLAFSAARPRDEQKIRVGCRSRQPPFGPGHPDRMRFDLRNHRRNIVLRLDRLVIGRFRHGTEVTCAARINAVDAHIQRLALKRGKRIRIVN